MSDPLDHIEAGMVVCETPDLAAGAWATFRACYPTMPLTILEGSPPGSDCPRRMAATVVDDPCTRLVVAGRNVGHGPGMHRLLVGATRPLVLLFDSDVEFDRPGFAEGLAALMTPGIVAAGQLLMLDRAWFRHIGLSRTPAPLPYVHPALHLVRRSVYLRLAPYGQHGAPCLWTALDARRKGLQGRDFPVWDYARHLGRGTRKELARQKLPVSYHGATARDKPKRRKERRK